MTVHSANDTTVRHTTQHTGHSEEAEVDHELHVLSTHIWFGPSSPLTASSQAKELVYRHIMFPKDD